MKILKKTMITVPVLLCCLLAVGLLWAMDARAAGGTGDFDVSGEVLNYEFDESTRILTIKNGAVLTIANKPGVSSTENRIVVEDGAQADITLNGVKIESDRPDDEYCAFALRNGAEVNLRLAEGSVNELKSGRNKAGLNVPAGAALTIGGTGRLRALCNGYDGASKDATNGAGIGGSNGEDCGAVTIKSGLVEAGCEALEGKGAGIGGGLGGAGGKVIISGGSVNAYTEAGATGSQSEKIGHGAGSTNSGTLTNEVRAGLGVAHHELLREPAVLTLMDGNGTPVKNTPITGLVASVYTGVDAEDIIRPEEYGIHGMATDDEGKLYLYAERIGNTKKSVISTGDKVGILTAEGDYYEGEFRVDDSNSNVDAAAMADLEPVTPAERNGEIDLSGNDGNLYIWNDGYMRGNSADCKKRQIYYGDYLLSSSAPTNNTVTIMENYRGLEKSNDGVSTALKEIKLKGLEIDASSNSVDNQCAFTITTASVNLILEGDNTLTSGSDHAGLAAGLSSTLLISEAAGIPGSLTAVCDGSTADANGAGIGGSKGKDSGIIVIKSGTVTARCTVKGTHAANGAGIGGGLDGQSAGRITIEGGTVTARCESENGDSYGAGIGGGKNKPSVGLITFGGGTIEASCTSTGGDSYGAGIGGGYNGAGGDVNIYGGNVYAVGGKTAGGTGNTEPMDIGHGAGSSIFKVPHRKAPWEESSMNVYLNILTVGDTADGSAMPAGIPIWGTAEGDSSRMTNDYSVKDVKTLPNPDGSNKPGVLYFYLTTSSEKTSDIIIQIRPDGGDPINYERAYARLSGKVNKAVLLPRPEYSIIIPAKLDFGEPTYKAEDAPDRYNDIGFEVRIEDPRYLSHGRSLQVAITDASNEQVKDETDFSLIGPGGDMLYYQIYKGELENGRIVPDGNPLKEPGVFVDRFDNKKTVPSYGLLRLDQTQIKYSGQYSNEGQNKRGQLIFEVDLVDVLEN